MGLWEPAPVRFKRKIRANETGCWLWTACVDRTGYGVFSATRDRKVPEGLVLDHLCEEHRCVNPAHLEPVTVDENIRRSATASRRRIRRIAAGRIVATHELPATLFD